MGWLALITTLLLILSLGVNVFQWHKWHSYRAKPSGLHSHTGMIPIQKKHNP